MKKLYCCSHCGICVSNRADWCDLGCGNDYNEMIEIKIQTNNVFRPNNVSDLIDYLISLQKEK